MRLSATTLLVTALGWITAATAHTIQLKSHSRECFHEQLHKDDRMTVSFQVGDREFGGSGNLEVDFWVRPLPLRFDQRVIYDSTIWLGQNGQMLTLLHRYRSRIPDGIASTLSKLSRPKITPSPHTPTANTFTASATRAGRPTRKRCPSTSMELYTCRKPSISRILWMLKVWMDKRLCPSAHYG